ncbi:hypothetical protein, partial [Helicobacter sp. 11S03491-1]|uniref:hypothetical protein n=1 Tax=Helicobacter sp. 11S03491-1 TaxID=1476196 RepID=UPI0015DB3D1B
YKSLNYRPQVNQTQKARPKNVFKPYESIPSPKSDSFYQNNHYKNYGKAQRTESKKSKNQRPLPTQNTTPPLQKSNNAWQSMRPTVK